LCNATDFAELRKAPTSGRMIVCVFVLNRSANCFRQTVEATVDTFSAGCMASAIGLEATVVAGQENIGAEILVSGSEI